MQREVYHQIRKLLPSVAPPLTPPIQPIEQYPPHPVQKIAAHRYIVRDCVIVVVANQNLVDPLDHFTHRHMPFGSDERIHFFQFLSKLLTAGFPLHSEPPFTAFRAVMRKSEEIKSIWLTTAFVCVFFGISWLSPKICVRTERITLQR